MQRRRALSLMGAASGATLVGCGGSSPLGPSAAGSVGTGPGIPVLAHYVSWWTVPGQWDIAASIPQRADGPGIAGYTSANPALIAAHNAEMQANGILPLVSWWGPLEDAGDKFLSLYLSQSGPPLGLLYEAIGHGRLDDDRRRPLDFSIPGVAEQFVSEMEHLRDKYFTGPSGGRFLRVDGRVVVFIWVSHGFSGPFEAVSESVRKYAYLVGSDFNVPAYIPSGHETVLRGLDAVTAYGFYDTSRYPNEMNDEFLGGYITALRTWREKLAIAAPGVMVIPPMTFAYDERMIPGRRGHWFTSSSEIAQRYALTVKSFADGSAPGFLRMAYMTSYNEHVEGSGAEPTTDPLRPDYLGIVHETFASSGP